MTFAPSGLVTLTTDFGVQDGYAAIMHGVILGIAPQARIVDISHGIPPQQLLSAAYVLGSALPFFPAGTVHVVVVDPGVGSDRRAVAAQLDGCCLVGPDNGVIAAVAAQRSACIACVALTEPRWWLAAPSATFHGRDIFAPVGAHLLNGVPLGALGPPCDALVALPAAQPTLAAGQLVGAVVHIDHFGNAITNLSAAACQALGGVLSATVQGQTLPLVRTYANVIPGQACAMMGSTGRLEIALRNGHAAQQLGLAVGTAVAVQTISEQPVAGAPGADHGKLARAGGLPE